MSAPMNVDAAADGIARVSFQEHKVVLGPQERKVVSGPQEHKGVQEPEDYKELPEVYRPQELKEMPIADEMVLQFAHLDSLADVPSRPTESVRLRARFDPRDLQDELSRIEGATRHDMDMRSINERDIWRRGAQAVIERQKVKLKALQERYLEYKTLAPYEDRARAIHAYLQTATQIVNDRTRKKRRIERAEKNPSTKRGRSVVSLGPLIISAPLAVTAKHGSFKKRSRKSKPNDELELNDEPNNEPNDESNDESNDDSDGDNLLAEPNLS